jgi:hypothetical protein
MYQNVKLLGKNRVQKAYGVCVNVCARQLQLLTALFSTFRGIVFRHYYRSLAKSVGKDFRDGAVVPFE